MKKEIILTVFCLFFSLSFLFALPKTNRSFVSNSKLYNVYYDSTIRAERNSSVNTGMKLNGSEITKSNIHNESTGEILAKENSTINTGLDVENGKISDSEINTYSKHDINASRSNINTGVSVENINNSKINTNHDLTINATNSNVNFGAIKGENLEKKNVNSNISGDLSINNKNVNIGNLTMENTINDYNGKHGNNGKNGKSNGKNGGEHLYVPYKDSDSINIGNVTAANASSLKEVNISVGSDSLKIGKSVAAKNKAERGSKGNMSSEQYVYVTKAEREDAQDNYDSGADLGNVYIDSSSHTKKVHVFVE